MVELAPYQCPLLLTCEKLVDENSFRLCCNSRSWIHCEEAREEAKKYLYKPSEWSGLKMPRDWLKGKEPPPKKREDKEKKRRRFFRR